MSDFNICLADLAGEQSRGGDVRIGVTHHWRLFERLHSYDDGGWVYRELWYCARCRLIEKRSVPA